MKYLIIGSGGIGGNIGAFLHKNNVDVTFCVKESRKNLIESNGLSVRSGIIGNLKLDSIKVVSENSINEKYDVVFVCVKGYSIFDILPVLEKATHNNSVIIPLLNGFGIGDKLFSKFNKCFVADGCIYIVGFLNKEQEVVQIGNIFKIVFGERENEKIPQEILLKIKNDLESSLIKAVVSDNIKRDTFNKFIFISAYAACGLYFNITAEKMQKEGIERDTFKKLVSEMDLLASKMSLNIKEDVLLTNLKIVDSLAPDTTASVQKDVEKGFVNEIDTLIGEVVRLGKLYNLDMPTYNLIYNNIAKL